MEQRNNLVLHGTETFSRGALDNVALESGAVVLDSSAGRYLPYGSYTTPELILASTLSVCSRLSILLILSSFTWSFCPGSIVGDL